MLYPWGHAHQCDKIERKFGKKKEKKRKKDNNKGLSFGPAHIQSPISGV